VSTETVPAATAVQTLEPDTVELHVRNVPRAVWLKARQAALASRLRFGQYVIKLLENAGPTPLSSRLDANACHAESSPAHGVPLTVGDSDGHSLISLTVAQE
jgi:hypothetical protein